MKSILKNKISLFTSLVLVVVMVFSSVSYAAEGDSSSNQVVFTDDMFTDSGYKDGSLDSVDSIWGMVGATDVNNSGMYQEAVDKWGKDNVDVYYCISTSPCVTRDYTLFNVLYIFCKKGTNVGIASFIASTDKYKHYCIQASEESMSFRRYMISDIGTWESSVDRLKSAYSEYLATYGTLRDDTVIICSNIPRFDSKDKMEEYLKTGNPDGALNYVNPDSDDSSAFGWDSFKGTMSGNSSDGYDVVINRAYSSSNMVKYPDQYYVSREVVAKVVGKSSSGEVRTGSFVFTPDSLKIPLSQFVDGYVEGFSNITLLSVYGADGGFFSGKETVKSLEVFARAIAHINGGTSSFDYDVTSCRLYITYSLYCKGYGIALPRKSSDIRCLSFDLLNYDGSSQGGEAVNPSEGREDIGSGGGSGGGTGDISQGINININNENTQNNGTGSGSDNSPKIDVADDDFSMSNIWKNVKSLFGLIDDPSTSAPDDGVMQVVKAGMDFLPSQYWTIVLGLLSSAGIVSIIRIFRGS